MSEVSGDDDAGAVLGFLYRVLRLEMHQLRGDDRPHHCHQPPKEFGGTRRSGRYSRLRRDNMGLESCRESVTDILLFKIFIKTPDPILSLLRHPSDFLRKPSSYPMQSIREQSLSLILPACLSGKRIES